MNTQNDDRDSVHTSAFNPFPEPQTIPSGWDTSGFFSAPEPASTTEEDDSAESGTQVNMYTGTHVYLFTLN